MDPLPSLNALDLSIVLPAYREAENLDKLLPCIRAALTPTGLRYEMVVVDTPTALDHTPDVCLRHGARHVARRGGLDYGNAVRTGIDVATGEYVVFMDADGSHPPEFIVRMLERRADADIVVASRYVEGGASENNALLRAMSRVLNSVYGIVLGIKCRDVSNSFRLYHAHVLRSLELRCRNFDIVEEILLKAFIEHKKLRLCEIPFTFLRRARGTSKRNLLKFIYGYIVTLVKLLSLRLTA